MRVLLTGITGNLGYEVGLDLNRRGFAVVPIIRSGKSEQFRSREVIINDLATKEELGYEGRADCIIHCAGNINFREAGDANERMTVKLVKLAKKLQTPLYFISTAYIYRPFGVSQVLNNAYEADKFRSEQALISSGIKYAIFRPSVLVGNSKSGEIQNFSGYYSIVKAFYIALVSSKRKGKKLRFPNLSGKSNLVPVDQAAYYIGKEVQALNLRSLYITNPNPPKASWVLKETLKFLNLSEHIELLDIDFEKFGDLTLSEEERTLYKYINYYYPYWSISYDFPLSACQKNLINHDYLFKTLTYLKESTFFER